MACQNVKNYKKTNNIMQNKTKTYEKHHKNKSFSMRSERVSRSCFIIGTCRVTHVSTKIGTMNTYQIYECQCLDSIKLLNFKTPNQNLAVLGCNALKRHVRISFENLCLALLMNLVMTSGWIFIMILILILLQNKRPLNILKPFRIYLLWRV